MGALNYLGLMTHVHTFDDLSEAKLAETWGIRFASGGSDPEFRFGNPYRLVELDDRFGRHAKVDNPPAREHRHLTVERAYWFDDANAPEWMRGSIDGNDGGGHLVLHCAEWLTGEPYTQYKKFMRKADGAFVLRADGEPDVNAVLSGAYWTHETTGVRDFHLHIRSEDYRKMKPGVPYRLVPLNDSDYKWRVAERLTVTRD